MKKRKILLGLALAAAAVFSLSACGDDTTPTTTPTTEGDGGSGTGTGEGGQVTPPTVEKVKVQYYKVIEGESPVEITGAKQEINKGSKTTKPETALAVDGYRIVECYTSAGCTDVFDFTKAINADTKVYVKYVQITKYDELSASANKVLAYDFNSATTVDVASDLKFEATEPKIVANSENVKVQNDVLSLGTANAATIVDFGQKITKPGLYNIYYEITFAAKGGSGESIAQINGTTGGSYGRVFELRNDSAGLAYSFDGSNKVATDPTVALAANKTIKIFIELNTAEGTIKVYNDGEKVVDTTTSITGVNGLKFQQNAAKSNLEIDNVAVTFEEKAASGLVAAKAEAIKAADDFKASATYEAYDAVIKTAVDKKIAEYKAAVAAKTTEADVATEKAGWLTYEQAGKHVITVNAYLADGTAVNITPAKVAYVESVTAMTEVTGVSFDGYSVKGVYADNTLTEALPTTFTADTTVYAKVESTSFTSVSLTAYENGGTKLTSATDITSDLSLGSGLVKFKCSSADNKFTADGNEKKGTDYTGAEWAFKNRVKSNGASAVDVTSKELTGRYVEIDLSSVDATAQVEITIWYAPSGTSERTIKLIDNINTDTATTKATATTTSSDFTSLTSTVNGGSKYYIQFVGNAFNIYGITLKAK